MESRTEPLPTDEAVPTGAPVPPRHSEARSGPGAREPAPSLQARVAAALQRSHRWLRLVQDAVLVGVAVLMLCMGVYVLVTGVGDLMGSLTLRVDTENGVEFHLYQGHAVVEVAENALLALILAELVGTLLLSLGGRPLTVQPFLIIAIVAAVRHLLLETARTTEDPTVQMTRLLGLGALILLLMIALALAQWVQRREPGRPR